jgi:hypothetical protein
MTNKERIEKAAAVMAEYDENGDQRDDLIDLLTDLRHLAAKKKIDFDGVLRMSEFNFEAEHKGKGQAEVRDFDEVRDDVEAKAQGYASIVKCQECRKTIAIIFKDFDGESRETSDLLMWSGNADEADVTCEDCRKAE